jgi:hypothetical protein
VGIGAEKPRRSWVTRGRFCVIGRHCTLHRAFAVAALTAAGVDHGRLQEDHCRPTNKREQSVVDLAVRAELDKPTIF